VDAVLRCLLIVRPALLGILATLGLYWSGLSGAFFFDDYPNIVLNPGLRVDAFSLDALSSAWFSGQSGQFGRPVSQLTFALSYFLAGGFDPFSFKLANLLLHCLNGMLVFLLAVQLLDSVVTSIKIKNIGLAAGVLAFVWMAHPIQLTTVLYAVQRMTSLSALFLLLALLIHIVVRRHDRWNRATIAGLVLAWGMLWPLSVLSKETGILFPCFIAAYELIIRRYEQGALDSFGRLVLVASVLLPLALLVYLLSPFGEWLFYGYGIRPFSLPERLLTEPRILWEYLQWVLFPRLEVFALFHDDIQASSGFLVPWTTLSSIVGLVFLCLVAALTRRTIPLLAFGISWFLLGHVLESSFIPLELAHEHRNYLPLFGIAIALAGLLAALEVPSDARKTLLVSVLAGWLALLVFVTATRAHMFGSEDIRTQIEAQHHPDSARANYEAGRTLVAAADVDRGNLMATVLARQHFERASSLDGHYKMGLFGLLVLECGLSQRIDRSALDELSHRFRHQLILQEDASILNAIIDMSNSGRLCLGRAEIEELFSAFLANRGVSGNDRISAYSLLADYRWLQARDIAGSRNALLQALQLEPHNRSLRLKWAQLDYIAGDREAARRILLELRGEKFTAEERQTLEELLDGLSPVRQP